MRLLIFGGVLAAYIGWSLVRLFRWKKLEEQERTDLRLGFIFAGTFALIVYCLFFAWH